MSHCSRQLTEEDYEDFKKIPDLMFQLEALNREEATKLTMRAIEKADWPYSMCGLGFGDPREWTPRMKHHAPVLLRDLIKAHKQLRL